MKINVELEIEPEELRRLIGLPDMQPVWDSVYQRISDGDTELIQSLAKTAFTEGMKTVDMSTRLLKTLSGLATRKSSTEKDAETSAAPTRRRSRKKAE